MSVMGFCNSHQLKSEADLSSRNVHCTLQHGYDYMVMDINRAQRWAVRCGLVGFAVALSLATLAYILDPATVSNLDVLYLILWPPSLGLMAAENSTTLHRVPIVLFLSALNGVLYFGLAFILGLLPKLEGPA